jgi:hypothetical protein
MIFRPPGLIAFREFDIKKILRSKEPNQENTDKPS